jgi:hypothetical protein
MRRIQSIIAAIILLLSAVSCVNFGQRLLTIQIEHNGRPAFEGTRGVPDNMPVNRMWDVLDDVPFTANTEQPHTNELSGDVVVRIKHVDRELASAKLEQLTLRPDADRLSWSLDQDETERIKQAAIDSP